MNADIIQIARIQLKMTEEEEKPRKLFVISMQ